MKKWIVTISAALSTLDLFWKDRIEKRPDSAKEEEMFGGKIRIRKVHNYGFALGMLSGEDRLVKGGSLGAGILLLIYYMKLLFSKKGKWKFAGTSLMLSGAVSNLYDRLKRGYVVDYIGFEAADPQIRKITFNLGDFLFDGRSGCRCSSRSRGRNGERLSGNGKSLLSGHK
ncbi:MAG: signal peptidase II [Sellimonas intestinalis]